MRDRLRELAAAQAVSDTDKMDFDDHAWVTSAVKIEIDIAEEPPNSWRTELDEQGQGQ